MTDTTTVVVADDQDMTLPGPWRRYRAAMQSALACSPEIWTWDRGAQTTTWRHLDGHWSRRHVTIEISDDGPTTIHTTDAQGQPCTPGLFAIRERDRQAIADRLTDVADVQDGLADGTAVEVYRSGVPIPAELCGGQLADYLLADGRVVRGQGRVPGHLHDPAWDRDTTVLTEHLDDIREVARKLPTLCSVARRAALWARCIVAPMVEETYMACLYGGRVPLNRKSVGWGNIPGLLEGIPICSATKLADTMVETICSWSPTWTGENSFTAIWGRDNLNGGLNEGPIQFPTDDSWESRWAPSAVIGIRRVQVDIDEIDIFTAGPTVIVIPERDRLTAWNAARVVEIPTPTARPGERLVGLLTQWQVPGYIYRNAVNIINRAIELKIVTISGLAAGFAQAGLGLGVGEDAAPAYVWEAQIAGALIADPEAEIPDDDFARACEVIELAGDVIPWIAWESAWERRRWGNQWRCKLACNVAKRLMKQISAQDDRCVLYRLVARTRELQVGMMLNGADAEDDAKDEIIELGRCLAAIMAAADDLEWMGQAGSRRSHIKRYLGVHGFLGICARMVENPAIEEELTSIMR